MLTGIAGTAQLASPVCTCGLHIRPYVLGRSLGHHSKCGCTSFAFFSGDTRVQVGGRSYAAKAAILARACAWLLTRARMDAVLTTRDAPMFLMHWLYELGWRFLLPNLLPNSGIEGD
jgi:hypothetical protein